MNIVLTNDDGYDAAGLHAAFDALSGFGTVHVVAPKGERSSCSHTITLRRPITVERRTQNVEPRFTYPFSRRAHSPVLRHRQAAPAVDSAYDSGHDA